VSVFQLVVLRDLSSCRTLSSRSFRVRSERPPPGPDTRVATFCFALYLSIYLSILASYSTVPFHVQLNPSPLPRPHLHSFAVTHLRCLHSTQTTCLSLSRAASCRTLSLSIRIIELASSVPYVSRSFYPCSQCKHTRSPTLSAHSLTHSLTHFLRASLFLLIMCCD